MLVSELAFQQLTTAASSSGEAPTLPLSSEDQSSLLAERFQTEIAGDLSNICFMDMRAANVLEPAERDQFKFVVFGGILGDHPPQDRAKDFRESFSFIRQLGTV